MDVICRFQLCFKCYVICFFTLFLIACGGGGGSSNQNTPLPIVNTIPIANAGVDQNIEEQSNAYLVGVGEDSDGTIASYQWTQTAGVEVTLDNATNASTSFVTPVVTATELLTFELQVTDNESAIASDSIDITVTPVNAKPTVNAGVDQNIEEQNDVQLDGLGADSDGTITNYQWTQTTGIEVTIDNTTNASTSFVAPVVTETELLTFELQVTDNENAIASNSVNITVIPVNAEPTANAGVDQNIEEQSNAYLDGLGVDSDGTITNYQWTQTTGIEVTLDNATNASTSFVAPVVTETELLTFELQVTDNESATAIDLVDITVTPVNEVQVIATEYDFWCSSQTQAVAWYDDSIAIVIEGEDALQFDFEAMSRMVTFFHLLYDKYESITGLTELPLDTPWQNRITIQIPLDNCGAGGLANHGVRGISVGRGLFDEQYQISLNGQERYHQVFFYESNRNFWPPSFNESFDWAMDNEAMNWGWWTVGMNNAMAVMMSDMLGVELEYYGYNSQWFRDRMVANFETYRDNLIYDFDYGWRQHLMPWDLNESINDLMSGLIIHSYETWGGETWLSGFYQYISTVPTRTDVFAYQECRDNIYRIWSDAAGEDLSDFFLHDLRWNITVDGTQQVNFKYSLADALAGGNGSFPGTGVSGTSVITVLNNQDYSNLDSIVDGAFVPKSEATTTISSSALSFDFSNEIGITEHDGVPSKGASIHTDPSLQTNNLGTNPDYSGDPTHHAFIDMHASAGITYNLQKIAQSITNDLTLNTFTARFGSATGANLNYWVLLDGVEVKYGELISGTYEAQDVDIALSTDDTYLTLVIGDANTGSINNAHGYIGDPILHGFGAKTNVAATPTNPAEQSISALAWQPLNWSYELGVNSYDIYLWKDGEVQPGTVNYNVTSTQLTPYYYLDFDTQYHWQIISNLDTESFTSPIYTFTVKPYDELTAPVYDISPAAQETRTTSYTLNGISQILGSNSNISSGLTIGFYGDSNTDNIVWQTLLVDSLSTLGVTALNRGINGADIQELWDGIRNYNAGGGLEEPAPFAEQIIADNIDVAIIYIGINDVLNNNPNTTTADYKNYLNLMVEACVSNNIKVVLVSPTTYNEKPDGSNLYDEQLDQYQVAAQEVAAQWNVSFVAARTHFINYLKNNNFSIQQDGNVIYPLETKILNSDSVHHNETGKNFLSDLVADGLQRALAQ